MNSENIDIEQMRKAWVEMGKALGMQSGLDNNPEDFNKKKTALDRLRDRYRLFWTMSLPLAFSTFMIFSRRMIAENHMNFWLGVACAVYFLTVFCMDFWLWRGIGSINPLKMSIAEIAEKSMFYRKRHLQFVAILIPIAIALIGFMGYVFSSEKYVLNGITVGAICGGFVGIMQFRRFMAEYRNLSD